MEHLIGVWQLRGDLYDDPVFLNPLHLYQNGSFEFFPDDAHRFAGRWGLYRDGPEDAVQENRENPSKHKGSRREGTHFWMWAQRGECKGFNMNADYRLLGRLYRACVVDDIDIECEGA